MGMLVTEIIKRYKNACSYIATNEEVMRRGATPIHCNNEKEEKAGHILRLQRERPTHTAMYWVPENGRRKRGQRKHG